jgi:pimeloyl-ACP methyl ester carboxylesterase
MARRPESTVLLGPGKSLIGIITAPEAAADLGGTCAVILNAGIIHRVGPNRLHVEAARALADSGLLTVRFDLSGIGDSEARSDAATPLDAALLDIRDTLDTLCATRGVRQFLMIGLCSGANHAIVSAAADERIVAVALIDPFIPRTRRYYFNHYIGRMTRARSWWNFVRGDHPLWQAVRTMLRPRSPDMDAELSRPDPDKVRRYLSEVYARARRRNVRILAAFTSDLESQHNYRGQILDAFPDVDFGDGLELHYFENTDHTFSAERSRQRLIDMLVEWSRKAR